MSCNPIHLGCYSHCGDICLPLTVRQTGNYYLEFEWLGTVHKVHAYLIQNQVMRFKNKFNENALTKFRIIQPDGTYYGYSALQTVGICPEDIYYKANVNIVYEPETFDIETLFNLRDDCV